MNNLIKQCRECQLKGLYSKDEILEHCILCYVKKGNKAKKAKNKQ